MNCKPGDLAYLVGPVPEAGMVVEVLHAVPKEPHWPDFVGPFWKVRSPMIDEFKRQVTEPVVPDEMLRPISGVPVEDEVTDQVPA